jgi:enoyl-CoA hydratase
VRTEDRGGVLLVTIDRPAVRNAVNRSVSEGVAAAMDRLDGDPDLRVGVLTGAGGTFCSGMDLKAFPIEGPAGSSRGFGGITARPPDKPVIAAVEGYALAGGFEMALAADLVVASRDATFGLPEVQRGLIAAAGGLVRIARALPYQTAMRMALLGERIGAEELHRLGVVTQLAEPGGALDLALAMAEQIASHAPLAVRASKRLVAESSGWIDATLRARQDELAAAVLVSEDAREGAMAFTEKRAPTWRGR